MYKNITHYKRICNGLVKKLRAEGPVLSGSLVEGFWKCKVKGCRCRKNDVWHSAHTVTWKENKKTRTLYIPKDLLEEVRKWNEEYQRLKGLIEDISEVSRTIIWKHVKEKKGGQSMHEKYVKVINHIFPELNNWVKKNSRSKE